MQDIKKFDSKIQKNPKDMKRKNMRTDTLYARYLGDILGGLGGSNT